MSPPNEFIPVATPTPIFSPTPEETSSLDSPIPEITPPALTPTPTEIPAKVGPEGKPVEDFEIEAFNILSSSTDSNSAINDLIKLYNDSPWDKPQEAKDLLGKYSREVQYKFKDAIPDFETVLQIAPIKPDQAIGETKADKITNWEEQNINALKTSDDPDQIAASPMLISAIKNYASEARRDVLGNRGEGPLAWTLDKAFRFGAGVVGPFLKLGGFDEEDRDLLERTDRARDEGIAGQVAGAVGSLVPYALATAINPLLGVATLGAQATGEVRSVYRKGLEVTGNEEAALEGSLLVGGAQAIQLIPLNRAATGLTKFITTQSAKKLVSETAEKSVSEALLKGLEASKEGFKQVSLATLEAGAVGSGGAVLANVGQNIALDQHGNITRGAGDAFLVNSIIAGTLKGGTALLQNAYIEQTKRLIRELNDKEISVNKDTTDTTNGVPDSVLSHFVDIPATDEGGISLHNFNPEEQEALRDADLVQTFKNPDGSTFTGVNKEDLWQLREARQKEIRKQQRDETLLSKDEDGHWIPNDEPPKTVEEQQARLREQREDYESYVNEKVEPDLNKVTDEAGEHVEIPVAPDYETDQIPQHALNTPDNDSPGPSTVMTWFFNKLGATVSLHRSIINGAFGAFFPKTNKIKILRSLGADPLKFAQTLAHEGAHFFDSLLNDAFKSRELQNFATKFKNLHSVITKAVSVEHLWEEGKSLSQKWRGGWDGQEANDPKSPDALTRWRTYRSNPAEVYADIGSAIMNAPEWVRENFPQIYKAFEENLAQNPITNDFWNNLREMEVSPNKLSEFNMQIMNEGRRKQGELATQLAIENRQKKTLKRQLFDSFKDSFQHLFNAGSVLRNKIPKLAEPVRKIAFDLYGKYGARKMAPYFIKHNMQLPLLKLHAKLLNSGIPVETWAHYLFANRILKDTSPTIERIKENYELYRQTVPIIKDFLSKQKGVKPGVLESVLNDEAISTPEGLTQALAQLGIVTDSAESIGPEDFIHKYATDDPKRNSKAMRDYTLAVEALDRRKVNIPTEALRNYIEKLSTKAGQEGSVTPELKKALQDVVSDNAFNVRRFLVNAYGYNTYDANRDLAAIRDSLTPKQYSNLQKISNEFHRIMGSSMKVIRQSGIFSPELLERMALNGDNYVTSNVLKYFQGDDKINSSVRAAIGSASETGNEITTTSLKMEAITRYAYHQQAINAAIESARLAGDIVSETKAVPHKDIFAERDKLSRKDPDHSYLIGYKDGKPSLYKIANPEGPGKAYENLFRNIREFPGVNVFLKVSDWFNQLFITRALKTVVNPAFVLGQKFMDRKMEAILANSFEVTLGLPIHTSGKLRAIDKQSKEELRHYQKTGELTGNLKKLVDRDAIMLDLHTFEHEGLNGETSFQDAVYRSFGHEIPGEGNTLDRIGEFTENALNKFFLSRFIKNIAEFDEARTKLNGFAIGKMHGMSDAEAAVFSKENFGVPDSPGGGTTAPVINRMFLFGVAHLNGLRTLGRFVKERPWPAASQAAYRVVLPKLMLSTAVMYPVMKSLFGDENADKYVALLNKIGVNEKQSRNIILLGAQDPQGNYHNFFSLKASDIGPDWKAWYFRFPQSREVTTVTKAMWPVIEGLFHGELGTATSGGFKGARSQLLAGIQPAIQYMYNIGELLAGENPTDFYRRKGILDKDTAIAGGPIEKGAKFGKYVLAQQVPFAVPYNPFSTGEPVGKLETAIQKYPLVGPLLRSMVGVTNYGDIEASGDADKASEISRSEIVLTTGDSTREMLNKYRVAAGQTVSLAKTKGKDWKELIPADQLDKMGQITSWHSSVWLPAKRELEAAKEAGDSERYSYYIQELEKSSKEILSLIEREGSE